MVIFLAAFLATTAADPVGETRVQNEAKALAQHDRLDVNHDGFVTYAEMLAATLAMIMPKAQITEQLPNDRMAHAEFDRADGNHDGRISADEAVAGANMIFDKGDTDHNGLLTPQERGAYMARWLAALQREISAWKPLPCQPGAACSTARHSSGSGLKRDE
ncbi:EF-hand domain-containing protein [Sphingomonas glacialis]|uniref:EF-hand domain-containing protein n=1 Tax=Sphingomonas glacialis TaxID=658225 RepID=A0A502FRG5_9SPHN|nr:hypothetical protein [Sphingomonas glacialis]TPG51980.1 hypothetical protein EAH76_14695 [Sphingomonas glacialis]